MPPDGGQAEGDLGAAPPRGGAARAWPATGRRRTRHDRGDRDRGGGAMTDDLLTVTGLTRYFPVMRGAVFRRAAGHVQAVDGIDFAVPKGQTLGIVGESGCGKTTTGRRIARLDEPTAGRVVLDGRDITHLSTGRMRPLRREIGMIFQDPYSSLNPRHTVGTIVGAPLRVQGVPTEPGA